MSSSGQMQLHYFTLPPELQWKNKLHTFSRRTLRRRPMKSRATNSYTPSLSGDTSAATTAGPSVRGKSVSKLSLARNSSSRICQSIASQSATADENASEDIKTWNLRPRTPLWDNTINKASDPAEEDVQKEVKNKSSHSNKKEKTDPSSTLLSPPEKRKLGIMVPLSKQEVEKDIVSMTGGRLSGRPKKRPKHLQKYMSVCTPTSFS
ncbi:uncharacterized protein LOC127243785 [Andrographis paniculata]|uniref:uncharacterized protein LOC127243785 n=1 Tax=Andrographis paniculata TaxID=175694 RepID=UPI0021E78AB0|nr:uncharacterized protein LOC127243785 [Andrographis paniculata]